ncbi:MAG: DUF6268 family outer membrane beta-barrel protein [Planctomycetaceae bacterium]|nr:DUF6268 family outer membrane beta-barrel protein [Planctomycetaceae bacterium]
MQNNILPYFRFSLIAVIGATFFLTCFGTTAKSQQFDILDKPVFASLFSLDSTNNEPEFRFFSLEKSFAGRTFFRQYEPNTNFFASDENLLNRSHVRQDEPDSCFFTSDKNNCYLFRGQPNKDDSPPKFYKISMEGAWTPSGGNRSLGMTRFKTEAAIMFPGLHFPRMKERSLIGIAPTFAYASFDWKRGTAFPKQTYEAGLEFTLMQPLSDHWGFMGKATPQWSSDGKISSRSISCSAMLGLRWEPNRRWEVMFGVMYLGQNADLSILPFGGVVWRPNEDWRIELMVPQMKIAKILFTDIRLRDHWLYVGGGFSGGNWAIRSVNDKTDLAMYQEFNIVAGYEISKNELYSCCLELGYVLGREMKFDRKTQSTFRPDNAFMMQLKFEF